MRWRGPCETYHQQKIYPRSLSHRSDEPDHKWIQQHFQKWNHPSGSQTCKYFLEKPRNQNRWFWFRHEEFRFQKVFLIQRWESHLHASWSSQWQQIQLQKWCLGSWSYLLRNAYRQNSMESQNLKIAWKTTFISPNIKIVAKISLSVFCRFSEKNTHHKYQW